MKDKKEQMLEREDLRDTILEKWLQQNQKALGATKMREDMDKLHEEIFEK